MKLGKLIILGLTLFLSFTLGEDGKSIYERIKEKAEISNLPVIESLSMDDLEEEINLLSEPSVLERRKEEVLNQIFSHFGTDNDKLSWEGAEAFLKNLYQSILEINFSHKLFKKTFHELDLDENGELDYDEVSKFIDFFIRLDLDMMLEVMERRNKFEEEELQHIVEELEEEIEEEDSENDEAANEADIHEENEVIEIEDNLLILLQNEFEYSESTLEILNIFDSTELENIYADWRDLSHKLNLLLHKFEEKQIDQNLSFRDLVLDEL
jgi:hypothetical protein